MSVSTYGLAERNGGYYGRIPAAHGLNPRWAWVFNCKPSNEKHNNFGLDIFHRWYL